MTRFVVAVAAGALAFLAAGAGQAAWALPVRVLVSGLVTTLCFRRETPPVVRALAALLAGGIGVAASLPLGPLPAIVALVACPLVSTGAGVLVDARLKSALALAGMVLVAVSFVSSSRAVGGPVPTPPILVALGCLALVATYAVASRFVASGLALLSMSLAAALLASLMPIGSAVAPLLAATGLALVSLSTMVRRRWALSAVTLVAAAVAAGHVALLLVPAWLVSWSLDQDRDVVALGTLTAGSAAAAGIWLLPVVSHSVRRWSSLPVPAAALRLGAAASAPGWLLPLAGLCALGGALLLRRRSHRWPLALAAASVLGLLVLFPAGEGAAQPLAFAAPLTIALGVLAAVRVAPSIEEALASRPGSRGRPVAVRFVLPAYNEEASIRELIERIAAVMTAEDLEWSVLVIDDGSSDRTGEIVRELGERLPVSVDPNERNLGLGRTIRRGLLVASKSAAPGEVIVTLDADLTQDPRYVPAMIEKWEAGADIVIASRFRRGSKVAGVSMLRRITTWGARLVVSTLMPVEGVRDYSCGFRLYDTAVLRDFFSRLGEDAVTDTSFAAMVEIVLEQRHRARFAEVPFELHYEEKRKASTMNVSHTAGSYFGVIARTRWLELTRAA